MRSARRLDQLSNASVSSLSNFSTTAVSRLIILPAPTGMVWLPIWTPTEPSKTFSRDSPFCCEASMSKRYSPCLPIATVAFFATMVRLLSFMISSASTTADPDRTSSRVSISRLVSSLKELLSPMRRMVPDVSNTSARPSWVRRIPFSLISGKLVSDGCTALSPRKTSPSALAIMPDLAEITGCASAWVAKVVANIAHNARISTEGPAFEYGFISTSHYFPSSLSSIATVVNRNRLLISARGGPLSAGPGPSAELVLDLGETLPQLGDLAIFDFERGIDLFGPIVHPGRADP